MSEDTETHEYEVVVVGGGPAGMTAALYSTRLSHRTAVVSRGGGRAAMMLCGRENDWRTRGRTAPRRGTETT